MEYYLMMVDNQGVSTGVGNVTCESGGQPAEEQSKERSCCPTFWLKWMLATQPNARCGGPAHVLAILALWAVVYFTMNE
eukprot:3265186-Amphidinium_carterae.1